MAVQKLRLKYHQDTGFYPIHGDESSVLSSYDFEESFKDTLSNHGDPTQETFLWLEDLMHYHAWLEEELEEQI